MMTTKLFTLCESWAACLKGCMLAFGGLGEVRAGVYMYIYHDDRAPVTANNEKQNLSPF